MKSNSSNESSKTSSDQALSQADHSMSQIESSKAIASALLPFDPNIIALDLGSLQAKSKKVTNDLNRTRKSLYCHLCASYLWWRKARKVHGYLDAEYKKMTRKFRAVKVEPNFIRLIWLIWGENSDLTNQYADRYSRALKSVHTEFEKHSHKYEKDGEARLANFILRSGGLSKIAGYKHPDDRLTTGNGEGRQNNTEDTSDPSLNGIVIEDARFHAASFDPKEIDFETTISKDEDVYSLSVVNQWNEDLHVGSNSHGHSLMDTVLSDYYLHQLDASDTSVRPILEIIQSQCYPPHLQKLSRTFDNRIGGKESTNSGFEFGRRVAYLRSSDQLLLSPTGSSIGVISKVTPNRRLLDDCPYDLFLSIEQRLVLEQELLQNRTFNLYQASPTCNFDIFDNLHSYARSVQLTHISNQDLTIDLDLKPLSCGDVEQLAQLDLRSDYSFQPTWAATVSSSWLSMLMKAFLTPWLGGHGNHLPRNSNVLLGMLFKKEEIEINFHCQNGRFKLSEQIFLDEKAKCKSQIRTMFRSQDWVVTMQGISLLPIEGDVSLSVNDDLMRVAFATKGVDGCKHEIFIPTVDGLGKLSVKAFGKYIPEIQIEGLEGGVETCVGSDFDLKEVA